MRKILRLIAFSCLTLVFVASSGILIKAAWTGVGNLNPYKQELEEFRSVWVATVSNIDIGKQSGTSEQAIKEWQDKYLEILNNAQKYNMNAIVFQIRPANDAFYPSKYNPWSAFLAGYGVNPGWDPLEWMIEVTHARGMEYHAWLNPYRISMGSLEMDLTPNNGKIVDLNGASLNSYKDRYFADLKAQTPGNIENPIFASGSELHHNVVLGTEDKFILNPASSNTIEHLEKTIEEIVTGYDIDGIHFDDYFYPDDRAYGGSNSQYKGHTFSSEPDVDYNDYLQYQNGGGTLSLYDWRRENVNKLIKSLSDLIRGLNAQRSAPCAFGISPAARWAPSVEACYSDPKRGAEGGMDGSCNNYYSYSDLYADTYKWAKEEWIDYIVPQNYTQLDGAYSEIITWWNNALANSNCKLFMGTPLYQVPEWGNRSEIYNQIRYNQSEGFKVDGYIMFSYKNLVSTISVNAMNTVRNGLWLTNALTPTYEWYSYPTLNENATFDVIQEQSDTEIAIRVNGVENAKAYAIYELSEGSEVDYAKDKLVAMALSSDNEIIIKYNEDCNYVLVTYDYYNLPHNNTVLMDKSSIIPKFLPVIDNISKIPNQILLNQKVSVTVKFTDQDSTSWKYAVYVAEDGINFRDLVTTNTIKTTEFTFEWEPYGLELKGVKFKITIEDDFGEVEGFTNAFDVVKKIDEPEPEKITCPICGEEYDAGTNHVCATKPDDPKGCSCKKSDLANLYISAAALLVLVIRKGRRA